MDDPNITHSTRVELEASAGEARPKRPIQAYAKVFRDEREVWLDLNGAPLSLITMTPDDTKRLIAILRASLADLEEG